MSYELPKLAILDLVGILIMNLLSGARSVVVANNFLQIFSSGVRKCLFETNSSTYRGAFNLLVTTQPSLVL